MFNSLSFKTKLLFLCLFMASVSLIISGISLMGSSRVTASFKRVTDVAMPNLEVLNSMFLAYRSIRIELMNLSLQGLSPKQAEESITEIKAQAESYTKLDAKINEIPFQLVKTNFIKT